MTAAVYLLAEFVEWVCKSYGGSVTSWYRSSARNAAKGGVVDSLHLVGAAVDVVYDGNPPDVETMRALARPYFVQVVREKDHDHFESTLVHLTRRV